MFETGIPLGNWSYELKTGNSIGVSYQRELTDKMYAEAGIEALSYRTVSDVYHVNIIRIPAGLTYAFYKSGKWETSFTGKLALSGIERIYDEAYEKGFNESYSLSLNISYTITEKNKLSAYTKYNQERFIHGKSYVGIGIAFGFFIF